MNRHKPAVFLLLIFFYLHFVFGVVNFVTLVLKQESSANHFALLDFGLRVLRSLFGALSANLAYGSLARSRLLLGRIKFGKLPKLKNALRGFIVIYGVSQLVHLIQIISSESSVIEYGKFNLLGVEDLTFARPLALVHLIVFLLLTLVPGLLISEYVELCYFLRQRIKLICVQTRDLVHVKPRRDEIIELQQRIFVAWEFLRAVDRLYSTGAFLWFIEMTIAIVLSIRSVMRESHSVFSALDAVYYLIVFSVLTYNASNVDTEAKTLQGEILDLRRYTVDGSVEFNGRLTLLEFSLKNSRMVLNSGDFCSIDRPLIVAILGAIATYTILLVQLAPADDKAASSHRNLTQASSD